MGTLTDAKDTITLNGVKGFIFTPMISEETKAAHVRPLGDDERCLMYVDAVDEDTMREAGRGPGLKGIVDDIRTGTRWKVYGASCGLPHCYCAARVVRVY
jgi:hypothetical protein